MNESRNDRQGRRAAGQQRTSQASDQLIQAPQQQKMSRWPLAIAGAAVVASYLLGRRTRSVAGRDARDMRPSGQVTLGKAQAGATMGEGGGTIERQGLALSEAPNASFASGAGSGSAGFDSSPFASSYLSNTDVGGPEQGEPYFPPGGAPDRDRSGPEQGGEHVEDPRSRKR
jgi:hypothetical protein